MSEVGPDKNRIFISRTGDDSETAIWVKQILEAEGFSCVLQDSDFAFGNSFVAKMREGFEDCGTILALMSPKYFASDWCMDEWDAAYVLDKAGKRRLFPVMAEPCEPPSLNANLSYFPLFKIGEGDKADELIRAVTGVITGNMPLSEVLEPRNTPITNIFAPVEHFTGREGELDALTGYLWEGEGAAALTAIQGLGGVGKSAIAKEYARRFGHLYGATWFVKAEDEASLTSDLKDFAARTVELPPDASGALIKQKAREAGDVIANVSRKPGLFVMDNIELPKHVPDELKGAPHIHMIVTSRYQSWGKGLGQVEIRELPPEMAGKLLLETSGREAEPGFEALTAALGGLPLAIVQAGAYLRENEEESFSEYLAALEKRLSEVADDWSEDEARVASTYERSTTRAEESAPGARDMLNFAAFFAADDIPFDLLARHQFGDDAEAAKKASNALSRYSLWSRGEDTALGPTRNMHRLLQTVLRASLSREERDRLAEAAAGQIMTPYPGHPQTEMAGWPKWEAILPHALALSGPDRQAENAALARLLSNCGSFAENVRAEYSVAEPLYRRAVDMGERLLGAEHPDLAVWLNNLAGLLHSTNRLSEAEPLYRRALAIDEASYGPDHPEVAIRLNNLATLLEAKGDWSQSPDLYRRALAIDEKSYGPDHPNVAIRLSNLADTLARTGRLPEALPLAQHAKNIRDASLPDGHPDRESIANFLQMLELAQSLGMTDLSQLEAAIVALNKQ